MTTKLETVIQRAGEDEAFRKSLLADPDATLRGAALALSEDDRAVLDEYCRVASSMTEEELANAIKDFLTASKQGRLAAGAG